VRILLCLTSLRRYRAAKTKPLAALFGLSSLIAAGVCNPHLSTAAHLHPSQSAQADTALLPKLVIPEAEAAVVDLAAFVSWLPKSGQIVPIAISVPSDPIVGGQSIATSITVSSVPSTGGNVQVGCDHPTLVSPPSGNWIYLLHYNGGDPVTKTITLTTAAVSQDTVVTIYACKEGVDATDPINWTATRTITLLAGGH
jgi:hypothetical protein